MYQSPLFPSKEDDGHKYRKEEDSQKSKASQSACLSPVSRQSRICRGRTHNYSVFPGKDGQLIETSNEVPARGDVASDEDADGEDREGVHRALLPATAHDPLLVGRVRFRAQSIVARGARVGVVRIGRREVEIRDDAAGGVATRGLAVDRGRRRFVSGPLGQSQAVAAQLGLSAVICRVEIALWTRSGVSPEKLELQPRSRFWNGQRSQLARPVPSYLSAATDVVASRAATTTTSKLQGRK